MRKNNNIINLSRISTCDVCRGHFKPLYSNHKRCRACYHGIRAGNAIYAAVKELRLSNKCSCSMEAKP